MEKSWWRRNALPLVAGVVLVAGALYSMVFTEWYNRYADEVVIAHAVATETGACQVVCVSGFGRGG